MGDKIAQRHTGQAERLCSQRGIELPNRDLAYLSQGTPEFDFYLRDLKWAQHFAFCNRA